MKHRNEDELAKLAFGELNGPEAERARQIADADPKAAEVLSSYREMAAGLRRMPVPEHQLSTERLRNALLDQNLKPRRKEFPIFKWLTAPIAVGAAAYLMTLAMHSANRSSTATALIGDGSSSGVSELTRPPSLNPIKPSDALAAPSDVVRVAESVRPNPGSRFTMRSESPGSGNDTSSTILSSGGRSMRGSAPEDRGGGRTTSAIQDESIALNVENAIAETAFAFDAHTNPTSPIILIGSDTDTSTGANRATEVSSSSNVVVGG